MNSKIWHFFSEDHPIEQKALLVLLLIATSVSVYIFVIYFIQLDLEHLLTATSVLLIMSTLLYMHLYTTIDKLFLSIIFVILALPLFLISYIFTPSIVEGTIYLVLFPFIAVVLLTSRLALFFIALFIALFFAIDHLALSHKVLNGFELASLMVVILFMSLFLGFYVRFSRVNQESLLKRQESLEHRVQERTIELEELNKRLKKEATTDHLTGLANREVLYRYLNKEIERYKRYKTPSSVILFDIDHFKNINDTYGHLTGDEVLKKFSNLAQGAIRSADLLVRYGGEEFVVVCPNTEKEQAVLVAQKLQGIFENAQIIQERPITASFGIAIMQEDCNQDKLLDRADKKLYQAKNEGRNRVCY